MYSQKWFSLEISLKTMKEELCVGNGRSTTEFSIVRNSAFVCEAYQA